MWEQLKKLISGHKNEADSESPVFTVLGPPPDEVTIEDGAPFPIAGHIVRHQGFPILDWREVEGWMCTIESVALQAKAWAKCEEAWLLHFRDALGPAYRLDETDAAALVSSFEPEVAQATLGFMERTRKRIVTILQDIARVPEWGRDILIVFDDSRGYYRYVSYYYPAKGEFSISGGMYINEGCGHFVTGETNVPATETMIAHEMTHAYLAHLPLPAWLNEGIAVNTERRLSVAANSGRALWATLAGPYPFWEEWEQHKRFWRVRELQEFWSGKSFFRMDEGSKLSYQLARVMVEDMAKDWEPFKRFVLAAESKDSGAGAAREEMGIDLGDFVSGLLEKPSSKKWVPNPRIWRLLRRDDQSSASE